MEAGQEKLPLCNEEALGLVFRATFIEYMTAAYRNGTLRFPAILAPYKKPQRFSELTGRLYSHKWVLSVREPISRPEYVLEYLGRYPHRVVLSNQRIVAFENGMVPFSCRDRTTNRIGRVTIAAGWNSFDAFCSTPCPVDSSESVTTKRDGNVSTKHCKTITYSKTFTLGTIGSPLCCRLDTLQARQPRSYNPPMQKPCPRPV